MPSAAAEARAMRLLADVIGPEKYQDYVSRGYFDFKGSDGKTYRIRSDHFSGNVYQLDRWGSLARSLCAYIKTHNPDSYYAETYPLADHHVAQYLMLKADAKEFLSIAYG